MSSRSFSSKNGRGIRLRPGLSPRRIVRRRWCSYPVGTDRIMGHHPFIMFLPYVILVIALLSCSERNGAGGSRVTRIEAPSPTVESEQGAIHRAFLELERLGDDSTTVDVAVERDVETLAWWERSFPDPSGRAPWINPARDWAGDHRLWIVRLHRKRAMGGQAYIFVDASAGAILKVYDIDAHIGVFH